MISREYSCLEAALIRNLTQNEYSFSHQGIFTYGYILSNNFFVCSKSPAIWKLMSWSSRSNPMQRSWGLAVLLFLLGPIAAESVYVA